jgi:hypothetical protein
MRFASQTVVSVSLLPITATAAACSGSGTASSDAGSQSLASIAAANAIAFHEGTSGCPTEIIEFTPVANACALSMNPQSVPGGTPVLRFVVAPQYALTPVTPGVYPIGCLNFADFGTCPCVGCNAQATSGSITITQDDSALIAGSFDLTFNTGEHVTGHFSAPVCPTPTPIIMGCFG